ncbi:MULTISPECIES: helix-turn-helix transcriptional regulator [unclassified Polaribacter]|uniref:helix-turn-helix transcriptional regulator n=1 Tax=unclassified Polaribacter TaxID=196858 RepID=UPI0011BF0341|nr:MULTISPECIES: AraC family transcriptional regulator [unclassified Polaribacter]TXD50926.1 helix-turn-helix transcriptional regulator [Polaribacter sp. IC063]TXD62281.1 helix-turn-helix transcriptional regulator [Polaribacter sp. IC066]
MIEFEIIADSPNDTLEQIKDAIGGSIEEHWGECTLVIDNENAAGKIRFIPFDWGVNLLDLEITFHKETIIKIKAHDVFNPIRFIYPSLGSLTHRFGVDNKEKLVEQFQSLIFTNKTGGHNHIHFFKGEPLEINIIQIVRKKFLKKRTTNVSTLNEKLYEVFVDTDHDHRFANYGTLNLKMADLIIGLKAIKSKGMLRILKIEARVYEMLSLHIQQHNRLLKGIALPTSLVKSELKIVRKFGNQILKNPAKDYTLHKLSLKSGLTQAKLQDGFKFLYKRTVTEYIRHVRLESARDLLKTTDLNVSQVVYSIGFSSRSYFSKIFREKYGITPNQFKKKTLVYS